MSTKTRAWSVCGKQTRSARLPPFRNITKNNRTEDNPACNFPRLSQPNVAVAHPPFIREGYMTEFAFRQVRGLLVAGTPRVSESGDAYDLASEFGADFSKLLVTGENPFDKSISLPSAQRVQSSLGGRPKYAACDAF